MTTQHTPGPWATDIRLAQAMVADAHGNAIADIARHEYSTEEQSYSDDRIAANARLIAAAPDLLAVLSAIVSDYHALQRSQGATASLGAEFTAGEWLGSRLGGHIARAESAISKAKGEE